MPETTTRTRRIARRITTFAVAVAATAGVSVAVAGPAQANTQDCQEYMRRSGYIVGPKVRAACNTGASGAAGGQVVCFAQLLGLGVARNHASTACQLAARR